MTKRPVIILTGGPGGGKSTLIHDLRRDPIWAERFVAVVADWLILAENSTGERGLRQ